MDCLEGLRPDQRKSTAATLLGIMYYAHAFGVDVHLTAISCYNVQVRIREAE